MSDLESKVYENKSNEEKRLEITKKQQELSELKKIQENNFMNIEDVHLRYYWKIEGGKSKVFIKKALRLIMKRLYGWFVIPLLDKQNDTNEKLFRSITMLNDFSYAQYEYMNMLEQNRVKDLDEMKEIWNLELNTSTKCIEQLSQRMDQIVIGMENINKLSCKMNQIENELESIKDDYQGNIIQLSANLQEVTNAHDTSIKDITTSVEYFQRHAAPDSRYELSNKQVIVLPNPNDQSLLESISMVQKASKENVTEKLNDAIQSYYVDINHKINTSKIEKELIVIFCRHFYNEQGIEANKNEAYDLFRLLERTSKYQIKLVSLEDQIINSCDEDTILYVTKESLHSCIHKLSPGLIVFLDSTPHLVFDSDSVFLKNHTILRLTSQNPLQGLDEVAISELRHCNDFGMHHYVVSSSSAMSIMEENGFRNVIVQYPIIDLNKFDLISNRNNINRSFTIGFASSPMGEEQYEDRGIYLLAQSIEKLPDISFKILWRNEGLQVPEILSRMKNCEILLGKYDMKQFYHEVDGVIIPFKSINYNHACPLSAIEALLHGIPVIATKVSGVSDLIEKYNIGIVSEVNSEELTACIQRLYNNYSDYTKNLNVVSFLHEYKNQSITAIIEDIIHKYYPINFATLGDWDNFLHMKDKYLVKGHNSICSYYQKLEVAEKYNEERFLQYPFNCFDAFERVSIDIAIESIGNKDNLKILDIASGDGRIVQENVKYGFCTAVDSSQAMLNIVQRKYGNTDRVETLICDFFVDQLNKKFDVVTTFRYIRHFDYKQRKMIYQKIREILVTGGMLVFDAPNIRYAMKEREGDNWGYYNIYDVFWTEETIIEEMTANHFNIKYLIPIGISSYESEPVSWTVVAIKS